MTESAYSGICLTCNHVGACSLHPASQRPIFHCEEYVDFILSIETIRNMEPPFEQEPIPDQINEYVGLCFDCANREHCSFQGPEEGVWHCEEYR